MYTHVDPKRRYAIPRQAVDLRRVVLKGYILDIGGGGEGIIGQLGKNKVVSIDQSERELREAPPGGLKIIMDARMLNFLDCTFDTVTAFFTLMYIPEDDREQIFKEIYRVLKKGGQFVIWDVVVRKKRANQKKDILVVPMNITLPHRKIRTAYSAPLPLHDQNCQSFQKLGEKVGFSATKATARRNVCCLRLKKINGTRSDQ